MTNKIKAFAKEHHTEMVEKGFWQDKSMVKKALLIAGELGEALEAHRKGKRCRIQIGIFHNKNFEAELVSAKFEKDVKDCFEDKIADTMLRLLDYCIFFKKPIPKVGSYEIQIKHEQILYDKNMLKKYSDENVSDLDALLFLCNKYIISLFSTESAFVCLLEIAKHMNFDLWAHVQAKRKYNQTRPFLFGKKY